MAGSETRIIGDIDDLRRVVRGNEVDLVQIEPGQLRGSLTYINSAAVGLSIARFSHGVRGRGVFSPDKVTFGIALARGGSSSQWSHRNSSSSLVVCPAGSDHESVYRGSMTLAVASASAEVLATHFGHEGALSDQAHWRRRRIIDLDDETASRLRTSLISLEKNVQQGSREPCGPDETFLQNEILEAFAAAFIEADRPNSTTPLSRSAAIVRMAEDCMETAGGRPVHIADLCAALRISRRTLHRAFSEVLGIGPMDFLRKARLGAVHAILKRSDPATTRIGDVAAEYGFGELGRFSAYYRRLFGELPSDTLRKGSFRTLVSGSAV